MKIRHPLLIKAFGFAGAWAIRGWVGTLPYRERAFGPDVSPLRLKTAQRYIYAFWHEYMLLPVYHYNRIPAAVLTSQHADGGIVAEVLRNFRVEVIRGSTRRGGVEALRGLINAGRSLHLIVTPDGPRGPRHQVQPGLVYLAARTGLPIVPVGFGHRNPWRLRSWDRFALPKPWTPAACVTEEPIVVPPNVERDQIEGYRQRVEQAIHTATEAAEQLAETGSLPQRRPLRLSA